VLRQLRDADTLQDKTDFDANIAIAQAWFDSVKPAPPTNRAEALAVFQFIEGLLQTETDIFRLKLLKIKLQEANIKFKDLKAIE